MLHSFPSYSRRAGVFSLGWVMTKGSYNSGQHYRNCYPGPGNVQLSVETGLGQGRSALQGVARSSLYYRPREASGENLAVRRGLRHRSGG